MEKKRKFTIASRNKKKAFASVFILFSILLFLSFVRIEYELLHYLSKSRSIQQSYFRKLREEALLEALLQEEIYRAQMYLTQKNRKDLSDYICANERGEHLLVGNWEGKSVGGYRMREPKAKVASKTNYKIYYYKELWKEEANLHYEIQVSVDYFYGRNQSLSAFEKFEIREVRIYLR